MREGGGARGAGRREGLGVRSRKESGACAGEEREA